MKGFFEGAIFGTPGGESIELGRSEHVYYVVRHSVKTSRIEVLYLNSCTNFMNLPPDE